MEERYHQQLLLKNFGFASQRKLQKARVLVIGAGGLGCPALQYLAAAGVGTLGIVDDDVVSLSNLHRQILFRMEDIGKHKTLCAKTTLTALNPDINFPLFTSRLTNRNALEIMKNFDLVVDGTDNFPSRYMINDACVLLKKPLISGAIFQYEGQLAVFNSSDNRGQVNYRDLFPVPPGGNDFLSCNETGVLGVLPGIIGTMQANETIKIITGLSPRLENQLLTYQALSGQTYVIDIVSNSTSSQIPESEAEFMDFDYQLFCSPGTEEVPEIEVTTLKNMLENPEITILDIRTADSIPGIERSRQIQGMPIERLKDHPAFLKGKEFVVVCQAGIQSRNTVRDLMMHYGSGKKFYSLRGGILEWKKYLTNPLQYGTET
jgi:molybdopterin/thiamine biosynthesis adenylyltransferase/rhodanese-related sulfurtransferase